MKTQQQTNKTYQSIEQDYINSMLGITEHDDSTDVNQADKNKTDLDSIDNNSITLPFDYTTAYQSSNIECDIFNIAGLRIAVPSSHIKKIMYEVSINTPESTLTMPDMCVGKVKINEQNINVIDLENLVMKGVNDFKTNKKSQYSNSTIVLLEGCNTAFIYNNVIENCNIESSQVHWRDIHSKRIWLSGTVTQLGLALLDIDGVIKIFNKPELL